MCIDDYTERHYSAIRGKQCRRFTFINQNGDSRSFSVNISQFQKFNEIHFCKMMNYFISKGLCVYLYDYWIPQINLFFSGGQQVILPFHSFWKKQIICYYKLKTNINSDFYFIKQSKQSTIKNQQSRYLKNLTNNIEYFSEYKNLIQQQSDQNVYKIDNNQIRQRTEINSFKQIEKQHIINQDLKLKLKPINRKKPRQAERNIRDVIVAVKKWRFLHIKHHISLGQAALMIKISKKSLDDYYLILRVGQILKFDFARNLDNKMGELRAYIRLYDNDKTSGRLQKQVQCFNLVADIDGLYGNKDNDEKQRNMEQDQLELPKQESEEEEVEKQKEEEQEQQEFHNIRRNKQLQRNPFIQVKNIRDQ